MGGLRRDLVYKYRECTVLPSQYSLVTVERPWYRMSRWVSEQGKDQQIEPSQYQSVGRPLCYGYVGGLRQDICDHDSCGS